MSGCGFRHGQNLSHPVHHGIFLGVHGMLRAEQLESRVQQERPEQIENPCKSLDENDAYTDHHTAHHESAQNSPEQQAMLVACVDTKELEDQQKEENVVYAERFLNEVAGEKLKSRSAPVREEYPKSKGNGKHDPNGALQSSFTQGNRVRAAVEQAKVEQKEQCHAGMKGGPERPRAHLGHARFHTGYFEAGHWRKKPQWFESCAAR